MSRRQSGVTLIEMAVVIIVLGIVLGGIILPLQSLWEQDSYELEQRNLENIKRAIYGYAFRNRTKGYEGFGTRRFYVARNINTRPPRGALQIELPVGRPYLPCPDITGDGYEDRLHYDSTGSVLSMPSPMPYETMDEDGNMQTFITGQPVNFLVRLGGCAASRGIVPWRTLGTPPADKWGNAYTYQVDAVFADSLVGFNRDSLINSFDIREDLLTADGITYRADRRQPQTGMINRGGNLVVTNQGRPPLICGGDAFTCDSSISDNNFLLAGRLADSNHRVLYNNFDTGRNDVTEGVPFAIVSHGVNGLGAVNYTRMLDSQSSSAGLICNLPSAGSSGTAEFHSAEGFNYPAPETSNAGNECQSASLASSSGFSGDVEEGFLYHQPRSEGGTGGVYDDIVEWSSLGELLDAMHSAFPALPVSERTKVLVPRPL